jgi:hypothetical protein
MFSNKACGMIGISSEELRPIEIAVSDLRDRSFIFTRIMTAHLDIREQMNPWRNGIGFLCLCSMYGVYRQSGSIRIANGAALQTAA